MLTVKNPATESVIAQVEEDDAAAIAAKVKRAKSAQREWSERSLSERMATLQVFNRLLIERADELAQQLTEEVGKPIRQSRAEVGATSSRIGFFLDQVESVMATETLVDHAEVGLKEQISHEPLGVIANISAWNYPYFVGSSVFVPALLTGNAVLYKPSELATLTGKAIAKLMRDAGVPDDVFQLVTGGASVGAELLTHPLAGVFFTGSYTTGCRIATAAAKHLMKVQLELGGKDPVYIADDVTDLPTVAHVVADGAFYNTGQSCCAVERIYVHERLYEAFLEEFTAAVGEFYLGDPMDEQTYIGPLARQEQLTVLKRQVEDALQKGATLICGGDRVDRPGYYFKPTVLANVNHSMEVMREESFGPIIGVQSVKDDAEAVEMMADTPYGLTAGVFTPNLERAQPILRSLNTGTVYWNCCDRVSPRLPWSGRGHSGTGLTLSTYGIQTFTRPKAWHLKTSLG